MAGRTPRPLSPAEAKAQLRTAAERASPAYWVQQRPWQLLLIALCSGFLAGRLRISPALAMTLSRRLLPVFAGQLLKRRCAPQGTRKP